MTTKTRISRRAMVAGAACAAPVAALGAVPFQVAYSEAERNDPIFAAIAAHDAAHRRHAHVCEVGDERNAELMDQLGWAAANAMRRVCETHPSTVLGASALALYIKQMVDQDADLSEQQSCALATLSSALAAIGGKPEPVLPEYNP